MNRRGVYALVLGAVFLAILVAVTAPTGLLWPAGPPSAAAVGEALWLGRSGEVLLQGLLILSGVIAILLLIGPARSGREP
jgi:hypothetical protein